MRPTQVSSPCRYGPVGENNVKNGAMYSEFQFSIELSVRAAYPAMEPP
jgi:hypothetical protein